MQLRIYSKRTCCYPQAYVLKFTCSFGNTKHFVRNIEIYLFIHHCIGSQNNSRGFVDVYSAGEFSLSFPWNICIIPNCCIITISIIVGLHISFWLYFPQNPPLQFKCNYRQFIELLICVFLKSVVVAPPGNRFPGRSKCLLSRSR